MERSPFARISPLALAMAVTGSAGAPPAEAESAPPAAGQARDGQRDFDFLFGTWTVKVRRLKKPLSASHEWYEFTGRSVNRPIWGGKGNIEEFEAETPLGPIQAIMVRLYSTTSRQWSLNWANQKNGRFDVPTIGEFKNSVGEFYDQEMYEGRAILVRYIWSKITPTSAHFEQSYSADGGKTWEPNWVADCIRVK